ncbi:hypothetical protein [Actinophytocola algeriensis]|uniref:Glycosyl hydrolase family 67 C-terminal domain-containing protein n=1 Tax=Actinophytocola algeriensis TaxID=1768010 RepID=A0A7W7QCB8_9PSEU|nr:hypothetical protein [Actinophytocola algeriensis]MBB4910823.1 hypothetical protein [Actinophytocola algeriensis]MBE1473816.1 hypothetical protein [Actinophytocola algeriensis]
MRADHRGWWRVPVVVAVLLGLGGVVAWQVNDALGLSVRDVDVPAEHLTAAPPRAMAPPPAVTGIVVPEDRRARKAAEAVADAYVTRGVPAPAIGTATGAVLRVRIEPGLTGEAYRIEPAGAGLDVVAGTGGGAAAGLYAIADRVRSGGAVVADGRTTAPRLGLRLTDLGGVGLSDDPARYRTDDYSLNSDVVGDAILPGAPYVDAAAVGRIAEQFRAHVDHSLALGYNAVVIPGFLEYVTFRGLDVYPDGDRHVARAEAMAAAFGPVWRYADDLGMRVFLSTDMLALSPPLRSYVERTVGGLDTEDPRLWQVYQAGLAELFDRMPFVAGLMVRIGEGGAVYQLPGWDYTSEIAVTTPAAVRAMLRAFLAVARDTGTEVIFRSWSVGIGAVGALHTSRDAYLEVLGDLRDDRLIVSTKYSLGDFYSHLPLNDTLLVGDHRRIVEFQSRREFEGLGALPNDLGVLHQLALRRFLAGNPHVAGVWTWAQGGGPLLAGPRSLTLRVGFWELYDLNTYVTGRLAWDPDLDPALATADWARRTFSDDPATVAAIGEAMALSREAVTTGLYIGPYADKAVRALGLEPPPMMWIFEWDIPTGDSAALGTIYQVGRDRVDEAVREGDTAVRDARRMRDLVAGTDPATWRDPLLHRRFLDTLDYQVDLFTTLGAYRTTVLRHAQWLDTGSAAARDAWHAAADRYAEASAGHVRRYGDDLDLPAFNLTAADLGLERADRDEAMAWLARGLLAAILAIFAVGALSREVRRPVALRALWLGATRPWRLATAGLVPTRLDRVLVWVVPAVAVVLSRSVLTWFAAPAHLVVVLGAWLLFSLVLRSLVRPADPFVLAAAVGGLALLRTVLLLAALALRGPGHYWFDFWTDPTARSLYVTVAFAAFLGVFVVAYRALRTGMGGRAAAGRVLIAAGAPPLVLGGLVAVLGLERALTMWNDQLALLPWGLSRILGITVHLEIPAVLPAVVTAAGAAFVLAGVLIRFRSTPAVSAAR